MKLNQHPFEIQAQNIYYVIKNLALSGKCIASLCASFEQKQLRQSTM